jgi:Tfp pilus assembly protein PilN
MNAVNLIPSDGRKQRLSVSTSPQTLGLFAGLALILVAAVFYVTSANKVSSRKGELAKVTAGVQQWQTAGNSYAAFVQTASERVQDLAVVRQLAGTRYAWSQLLSQIGDVMPSNASLTALQVSTSDTSGAGATTATTPAPTTTTPAITTSGPPIPAIQLTGCATSQSAVAQTLINLHKVKGVTDVSLSSSTDGSASGSSAPAPTSGGTGNCKFPVQFQAAMTFGSTASSSTSGAAGTTATTASTPATTTSTPATTTSTPAATTTPAASASAATPTTNSAAQ